MKTFNRAAMHAVSLVFAMGFGLSVSAQESECLGSVDGVWGSSTEMVSNVFRATPEIVSEMIGIPMQKLQEAMATNPAYTVIVEDQVIPYYEFGPALSSERKTQSGSSVFPMQDSLTIVSSDGSLSEIELKDLEQLVHNLIEMPLNKASGDVIEPIPVWAYVYPTLGAGTCWIAAQDCVNKCNRFIQSCPCGGQCSCGPCGTAPSRGCAACSIATEPPDMEIGG